MVKNLTPGYRGQLIIGEQMYALAQEVYKEIIMVKEETCKGICLVRPDSFKGPYIIPVHPCDACRGVKINCISHKNYLFNPAVVKCGIGNRNIRIST